VGPYEYSYMIGTLGLEMVQMKCEMTKIFLRPGWISQKK